MTSILFYYLMPVSWVLAVFLYYVWAHVEERKLMWGVVGFILILTIYDLTYGHFYSSLAYKTEIENLQVSEIEVIEVWMNNVFLLQDSSQVVRKKVIDKLKANEFGRLNHPKTIRKYSLSVSLVEGGDVYYNCTETSNIGFLMELVHPNNYVIGVYRNDDLGKYLNGLMSDDGN